MSGMQVAPHTEHAVKLKLVLSWLFVGIPLLWGISETIKNAMNLFH